MDESSDIETVEPVPEGTTRTKSILIAAAAGLVLVVAGAMVLRGKSGVEAPKIVPARVPSSDPAAPERRPPLDVAEGALVAGDLRAADAALARALASPDLEDGLSDRVRQLQVRLAGKRAAVELAELPSLAAYVGREILEKAIAAMDRGEDDVALVELYEFVLAVADERSDHRALALRALARLRLARLAGVVAKNTGSELEPRFTYGDLP